MADDYNGPITPDALRNLGERAHDWRNEAEERSRYGYTVAEIAAQMEITPAGVRYLLSYFDED
jgi:hypothetical protein